MKQPDDLKCSRTDLYSSRVILKDDGTTGETVEQPVL